MKNIWNKIKSFFGVEPEVIKVELPMPIVNVEQPKDYPVPKKPVVKSAQTKPVAKQQTKSVQKAQVKPAGIRPATKKKTNKK